VAKRTSDTGKRSIRVEHKHRQTRNEILQIAQELLMESGLDAVTLAAVAGRLSMTKQALYHYFPSKEALIRSLITTLLDEEIETLVAAIDDLKPGDNILGGLINAFYGHYIHRLDAFRTIYCQSQLYSAATAVIDRSTLQDEINPTTRQLFDRLEVMLAGPDAGESERRQMRQLAFTAWMSALGLMTMLGVADASSDPLVHSDRELLDTLSKVYGSMENTSLSG